MNEVYPVPTHWTPVAVGIAAAILTAWPALLLQADPGEASCVTAECHAKLKEAKHVHAPVAVGRCSACHTADPKGTPHAAGPDHRFKLVAPDARLCFDCHPKIGGKAYVHEPIKKRMCVICHDPHRADAPFLLRVASVGQLCFQCHKDTMRTEKVVHGPVSIGQCTSCHDPHESDYPHRLRAMGPQSCFACHKEKEVEFAGGTTVHKPITEDCGKCHDPHDSPHPFRLRKAPPDLCFGCHEDKAKHIASVAVRHGAIQTERSCLNCHNPHVSGYPKLLLDVPMNLCLKCHDQELDTPFGRIRNMKGYLAANTQRHGPIREGDCSACHNPHGENNWRMLKLYFPPQFYAPYDLKNYALCFNCHQKTLALDPQTTSLTGFRNGSKSLHFAHVNKEVKGRTCRACHDLHATNYPKMITAEAPFGEWKLPIEYEKSESGGKCTPGCHFPRGYDRVKEVANER